MLHFSADIVICTLILSAVKFIQQYDWSRFFHLTILCQDLMTGVMCSRPEFKLGLHNKSHVRLVAVLVVTVFEHYTAAGYTLHQVPKD